MSGGRFLLRVLLSCALCCIVVLFVYSCFIYGGVFKGNWGSGFHRMRYLPYLLSNFASVLIIESLKGLLKAKRGYYVSLLL